jgi:hypothetical protein
VLYWLSTPFMGFWWLLEFNRTDRARPSRSSSSGSLSLPAICTTGRAHDTGNGHTSHALLATWSLTNPCCWHPTRFQLARMAPQRTPIGFFPLRRFSWLSPLSSGLPHPIRSASRFSQPLSGLLLYQPGGSVSCLVRPWGSSFRGFPSRESVLLSESLPSCRWKGMPTGRLRGLADRLSNTHEECLPDPISTSGVSPHMSPFTCWRRYPLCRAVPLLIQPSRDFTPTVPAPYGTSSPVLQLASVANHTSAPALRSFRSQQDGLVSRGRLPPLLSFLSLSDAIRIWLGQLRAYGFTSGSESPHGSLETLLGA